MLRLRQEHLQKPKEHHGREKLLAATGAFGEFLAVKLGADWLGWLSAVMLSLSVLDYTRGLDNRSAKIFVRLAASLSIFAVTYYLISWNPPLNIEQVGNGLTSASQMLDPHDPLTTRFTITNSGPGAVILYRSSCSISQIRGPNGLNAYNSVFNTVYGTVGMTLGNGGSTDSEACLKAMLELGITSGTPMSCADLLFTVDYGVPKDLNNRKTKVFRYVGESENGYWGWTRQDVARRACT